MLNYLIVCHISGLKSQLHEIKKKIHIHFNKIEIYNEPKNLLCIFVVVGFIPVTGIHKTQVMVSTSTRIRLCSSCSLIYPLSKWLSAVCRALGAAARWLWPQGVMASAPPLGKTYIKQICSDTNMEITNGDTCCA